MIKILFKHLLNQSPIPGILMRQPYLTKIYFDWRNRQEDPYKTKTSERQLEKFNRTLGLIAEEPFFSALDVGCGKGTFTSQLTKLGHNIIGVDISDVAVREATNQYKNIPNVSFRTLNISVNELPGFFDLILCMEILYYVLPEHLESVCQKIVCSLETNGRLVLVHTLKNKTSFGGWFQIPFGGDEIYVLFNARTDLEIVRDIRTDCYRLSLFVKR